ncbi:MAG TPA: UDP-N-acetylglucosamine 2-epimerase (non-hydrolyzing) [Acidimicrobiia bacterium]
MGHEHPRESPAGSERIAVVYGTRPEAVKLRGVVALLGDRACPIHTGQHYDPEMAAAFESGIGFPPPEHRLAIGGGSRGRQIADATVGLESLFAAEPFAAVVVQGDTNTALSGALAANAGRLPLVHVEAGLRSYDREMPEEHNRTVVDHLADLCCAPTTTSEANLAHEGIVGAARVTVTGNTVVEAVLALRPDAAATNTILAGHGVEHDRYVLATFHRPENVDDPDVLSTILTELAALPIPVILPLHPRTAVRAAEAGLEPLLDKLLVTPPVGYREFLGLMGAAALLVSDSGGVQEESSVVKRPVIVVRRSTERPEVLGTFSRLVPSGPGVADAAREWLDDIAAVHERLANLPSPYGDGHASALTVAATDRLLASR